MYCRVSTDGQELEQQVQACKNFADYKGFEYCANDIFSDVGSGKNMQRPNFQRMLADLRLKKYDGVILFRFDRIGRNSREVVMLFDELESKGISIFSINENLDTTTPIGRAMREILIILAQLERENISDATRQRLKALGNLGKKLGRPKGSVDKKVRKISGYLLRYANKGGSRIVQDLKGK